MAKKRGEKWCILAPNIHLIYTHYEKTPIK